MGAVSLCLLLLAMGCSGAQFLYLDITGGNLLQILYFRGCMKDVFIMYIHGNTDLGRRFLE